MSRRILRDIEEALSREVRRITFHSSRTLSTTVLRDTFDPLTGELVQTNVEANYYDSSADTKHILYPHFFVKLLRSREDRFTGRGIPNYGAEEGIGCSFPTESSYKIYERILYGQDGIISVLGNTLKTTIFNISKVQVGNLIRVLSGNNKGTYTISNIIINSPTPHEIVVSNDLITGLSALSFESTSRVITFLDREDLNTIKVGDVFRDSSLTDFTITAISISNNSITVGGTTTPSTSLGGKILRVGNVFQHVDSGLDNFIIMDQTKPIERVYEGEITINPSIPLDLYYLVRIDSKQRDSHVDILNRMWEEFNPPRTGLPVIVRSADSAEQELTADVTSGGSYTINIGDNSLFKVNDSVYIFDDFTPSKSSSGGFEELFEAKVVNKVGTNQITLDTLVPDTFIVSKGTTVVSNASFKLLMFHFVDHVTKDVEGSQYWVHEFTFWVQAFIDRQGEPVEFDASIKTIQTSLENLQGYVYSNS